MIHEEAGTLPAWSAHGEVPFSIWPPAQAPRSVVLLGPGLGADRYDPTVAVPVSLLVGRGAAVIAPDLPLHGQRDPEPGLDWPARVDRWQRFWAEGGVGSLAEEWCGLFDFAARRFAGLPIGYFGLSLGTQYGIPFLARGRAVEAAVLGLFGSFPEPRTPVMNGFAPRVRCPLLFLLQQGDEIHSPDSARHLFETLGSRDKRLVESPGSHAEVPSSVLGESCDFLASTLAGSPGAA